MIQKIKKFLKTIFSARFTHPVVNEKLSTAIDDKLKKRVKEQGVEIDKNTLLLNSYLRTYFSKQYETPELMRHAFDVTNKEWQKHCRNINSTSKLINLDKEAFKKRVQLTIKTFNETNKN
ncbi:MAG: hypothetical protein V4608_10960 [Bacteroidota bacterium]